MILPRQRAWSSFQKGFIVAGVVGAIIAFGTFVYAFERHYGLPSDQVLVGTWTSKDFLYYGTLYVQLSPDHNCRFFVDDSDVLATGRWYAGGNFAFFRWSVTDEPEVTHGLIWRIDKILPNEIHVHKNPNGLPFTFTRVSSPGHRDAAIR
jgi:hypothetical protein